MINQSLISNFYARGDEVLVLVRVRHTKGSTPREVGAMMMVGKQLLFGSIGGGRLEQEAIHLAWAQIKSAEENLNRKDIGAGVQESTGRSLGESAVESPGEAADLTSVHTFSLGASLGQCCGGKVELSFETLLPRCELPKALQQTQEPIQSTMPPIILFGAGHVGRALVGILATLPCHVTWVDSRAHEFARYTATLPPHIKPVLADPTEQGAAEVAEVASAPAGAAYVVMTHSHALDLEICTAILRRHDFSYAGLIGSQTKAARFQQRLKDRNITYAHQLVCPIGILGITGKEPAVVALSIAASLAQLKKSNNKLFDALQTQVDPRQQRNSNLTETL
jgi:xanthine dehydrogenase accessory factor